MDQRVPATAPPSLRAPSARRAPSFGRAPSDPRAGLARADTPRQNVHNLYVKVAPGADGDHDHKSREITVTVLKYIHTRLAVFAQMGLTVKVHKIRSQDLQNPRLVEAMRKRGITRLPALTTPNSVYIGAKEISDLYERNVKEFAAMGRRGERPVEGALPEDDLDEYFKDEMTFARAEEDAQETGIGEGEDMMNSYRSMMERREKPEGGRPLRPPGGGRPVVTTSDAPGASTRSAPPSAAPGASTRSTPPSATRPDNVGPAPIVSIDAEDAEIQETIERLARDIDDNTRARAFASGGGDSLDDDGGADPQDDLMERAYWGGHMAATELAENAVTR